MTVGRTPGKTGLDSQVANLATGLLNLLEEIRRTEGWLSSVTDGDLEALGYTTDDVYLLRLIYNKLDEIRVFTQGGPVPAAVYDLSAQLVKVAGVPGA